MEEQAKELQGKSNKIANEKGLKLRCTQWR
jgi:hypothetical protein